MVITIQFSGKLKKWGVGPAFEATGQNMPESNGNDSSSRIDRIERILEQLATHQLHAQEFFEREHKQLLTAQIVLTDRLDRLTVRVDKLALAQEDTADKLNVLIALIDQQQRERGSNPAA